MSAVHHFIEESVKKAEISEYLKHEFERAGFGSVDITKTPLGTHIVIYAMRPGLIIGRGGETIKNLAKTLEENFQLPNPQISVAEIEIPELVAEVVASRIASALKRGVHFRRAGFWALNQIMEAGALGGKLLGAGGGGFILFFAEPKNQQKIKEKMKHLLHVPFKFENSGSQIIYDSKGN